MENTLENKSKFFALYWGQEVIKDTIGGVGYPVEGSNIALNIETSFLHLKPLSSISDEDAIEVAKIMTFHDGKGLIIERKNNGEIEMYDRYNDEPHFLNTLFFVPDPFEVFSRDDNRNWFQYDAERISEACDYLRSKGYALKWLDKSVEDQLSDGWIKLKED